MFFFFCRAELCYANQLYFLKNNNDHIFFMLVHEIKHCWRMAIALVLALVRLKLVCGTREREKKKFKIQPKM